MVSRFESFYPHQMKENVMKKFLFLLPAVLMLAACGEASQEQLFNAQQVLPEDCKIYQLGRFGYIDNFVVVTCPGIETTTTNTKTTGKQGKHAVSVSLSEQR